MDAYKNYRVQLGKEGYREIDFFPGLGKTIAKAGRYGDRKDRVWWPAGMDAKEMRLALGREAAWLVQMGGYLPDLMKKVRVPGRVRMLVELDYPCLITEWVDGDPLDLSVWMETVVKLNQAIIALTKVVGVVHDHESQPIPWGWEELAASWLERNQHFVAAAQIEALGRLARRPRNYTPVLAHGELCLDNMRTKGGKVYLLGGSGCTKQANVATDAAYLYASLACHGGTYFGLANGYRQLFHETMRYDTNLYANQFTDLWPSELARAVIRLWCRSGLGTDDPPGSMSADYVERLVALGQQCLKN